MATPNLLHLFATAIQVASTLSGEMRFSDLSAAFKMTCELQQYIVNASFRRTNNSIRESPSSTQVKPDPDDNSSIPTSSDVPTNGEESSLPCSSHSSTTEEVARNPTGADVLENAKQPGENDSRASCNDQGEGIPLQQQLVNRRTQPQKRHRMVALETLHPDQAPSQTPCEACRLRMGLSIESFATMACPACPKQPAICSAQCFRWWHNRFPELLANDHSNMCSTLENTLEEISCTFNSFPFSDTSVAIPVANKPARPVRRSKHRRRKLQLTSVKRAGLRKHCARRAAVLRNVRKAVALDNSTFAQIYQPPKPIAQTSHRYGTLVTCNR